MSAKSTSVKTSAVACVSRDEAHEDFVVLDPHSVPAVDAGVCAQLAAAADGKPAGKPHDISICAGNLPRHPPTGLVACPAYGGDGDRHHAERKGGAASDAAA